jgi:GNAT superfamily N-acetyltransferase
MLDYADEARLDFDQAVFRKLMQGRWWVGVLAVAADGSPVGFELALERTLRVAGRTLSAYYASVFTVSADHRRQGLGRWILEGINRLVFAEHHADVILSTFHQGHAGSPAVQSTFDRIPAWGVVRFHQSPIWSRRLDQNPLPPLELSPSLVQLERDAGAIDDLIGREFTVSFALSASLSAQYLNPDNPSSGLLLHDLGSGRIALAGFNILPMAINQRRLRPIGQLQLLAAPGSTGAQIESVVHHMGLFLAERGCFAITLLDTGVAPRSVLDRLGFTATDTLITFAARGPKRTIAAFEGLRPPFFLDFA